MELAPGVRTAPCDLEIKDDSVFEEAEFLLLRLADPTGCSAELGDLDVTVITINDPEDGK